MSAGPIILLVEGDLAHAHLIAAALTARGLPHPVHVRTGEEAVLWIGAHACDVCVLDYQLRGIDGLETLLRLRQRKPALPVIMTSGARSEQVAVAAFRAGVSDYIPKKTRDFPDAVVEAIQRVTPAGAPSPPTPFPVPLPADVPAQLLAPTLQNRLRVIGRQLDLYGYRAVNLSQVAGGFLVRAIPSGARAAEVLEFPDHDVPQALAHAIAARGEGEHDRSTTALLPTGYEDFLRALGHRLDLRKAEAITVTELDSLVAVGGIALLDGRGHMTLEPFHEVLHVDGIAYLLDEAFRRRAEPQRSGFARLLGR
jgi:CheY-like chemotaxis protein